MKYYKYLSILIISFLMLSCSKESSSPGNSGSNSAPTADAGADQTVDVGAEVTLDGSASADEDGDKLTYSWRLDAPEGSDAQLSATDIAKPTFTPDIGGDYTATLTVSDGNDEDSDKVVITANEGGNENQTPPDVSGKIAYTAGIGTAEEIYIVNADGTGKERLTNNNEGKTDIDVSPNGEKIAFVRVEDLWVMNIDGSNKTQLTTGEYVHFNPKWSPDGSKILYSTKDAIFTVDVSTKDTTRIYDPGFDNDGYTALWSPDGSKVLLASDESAAGQSGTGNLYLVNADGSNVTQITNYSQNEPVTPYAFYASGSKIIFTGEEDIYTINTDGTNLTKLLDSAYYPELSPDKTKIRFFTSGGWRVANIDGTNIREILNILVGTPIWSPNGNYFAYTSRHVIGVDDPDNVNGIWIVETNGGDPFKVAIGGDNTAAIIEIIWFK